MKKILFIGDTSFHYQKSIIDALEWNGFEVFTPRFEKYHEANRLIKFFYKNIHKRNFIYRLNGYNLEKLNEVNPDLVFIVNDYFMDEEFLIACEKRGIPVYGYCMDALSFCNKAMEGNNVFGHLKYYTAYYSYEPTDVRYVIKNGKHVKYLPIGFDERYFSSDNLIDKFDYDIFFAGSLDNRRRELLNEIAKYAEENQLKMIVKTGIQLKKFESILLIPKLLIRQSKFKAKYPYLFRCIDNNTLGIEKISKVYALSRFCINIHSGANPEEHTGPNPRTFETMAAGSCLVTDVDHLLGTGFVDGKELIAYSGVEDLIKKLDYYNSNEQERKKLALVGRNACWERFTQRKLIRSLLEEEGLCT